MAKAAILNIDILATADKAIAAFDKIKAKATDSNALMKYAAAGAATAIIGGLTAATVAAMDHETQVAKLSTAYKDAGVSTAGMAGDLDQVEASSRRTGQSTEDNIAAFTKLVTATKNTAKAHSELSVAEDLAAFKGISVSDAADAITKASEGNTKALKAMGIQTTDTSGKQLSAKQIMDNLTQAVKGQADAFGDTSKGKIDRYNQSLEQMKEKVGEALLPVLTQLLNLLQPLFNWMDNNTAAVKIVSLALGGLAVAFYAVNAAVKIFTVSQAIMEAGLLTDPIVLITAAIAAFGAAVYLAMTDNQRFKNALDSLQTSIDNMRIRLGALGPVFDALTGPVNYVIGYFQHFHQVVDDIINALNAIGGAVSNALGWLGKLPSSVKSGGQSVWDKLNPFSLPGGGGPPTVTPVQINIVATPGDALPEVVYQALKTYQRRHVRPELAPLFNGRG